MHRHVALSIALPLLLLAVAQSPGCTATPASGRGGAFGTGGLVEAPSPTTDIAALERQMFERVNDDRATQGRAPLSWDDDLADLARGHALDMVESAFFEHDSPNTGSLDDRLTRAGYRYGTARENLAIAPDVHTAQDGLLDSPGHRANIFSDDVTRIGIGIVRGVDPDGHDTLYFTQVFARQLEILEPDDVADDIAARLERARRDAGLEPATRADRLDALAAIIAGRDKTPRSDEMQRVALELRDVEGLPVGSVGAVASMLYEPDDIVPDDIALDRELVAFGVGAVDDTDEAGRPTVSVIVLLAYR